jgi:hypothetical protein
MFLGGYISLYQCATLALTVSWPYTLQDSTFDYFYFNYHLTSFACTRKAYEYFAGIEVSRTPKGLPEQLAIVLTYQCKLFLFIFIIHCSNLNKVKLYNRLLIKLI